MIALPENLLICTDWRFVLSFIPKKAFLKHGDVCSCLSKKLTGITSDLDSNEWVKSFSLAWFARFPFLAKADDVCTHQDNSIGITMHTPLQRLQPYCGLLDEGQRQRWCTLQSAECNNRQGIRIRQRHAAVNLMNYICSSSIKIIITQSQYVYHFYMIIPSVKIFYFVFKLMMFMGEKKMRHSWEKNPCMYCFNDILSVPESNWPSDYLRAQKRIFSNSSNSKMLIKWG